MKIKKSDWAEACSILEIALDIVDCRGDLGDEEYGDLLENSVVVLRRACEYAFHKSISKTEKKELYGASPLKLK